MRLRLKLLLIIGLLYVSFDLQAQKPEGKYFDFEFQWGIYGHYKVSSKKGRVYINHTLYKIRA